MSWKFEWFENGNAVSSRLLNAWAAAAEDHGNIWQCPAIAQPWERTVAKVRKSIPYILTASNSIGQEIVYPLYARAETVLGIDCTIIEPLGGEFQFDYQDPLELGGRIDEDQRTLFWKQLRQALRTKFGPNYEFIAYRLSGASLDVSDNTNGNTAACFIDLKGTKCWEEFLSGRGKKLRDYVTRGLRRLGEMGCTSLTRIPESQVPHHMAMFCEMYQQQWGREGRVSALRNPGIREFWIQLAERAAAIKKLHFSALIVNHEPWSYHLGFEHRNILLWYKPTYNVNYEKYSPGTLHLALAIQDCIERQVERLDLGWGTEPYKFRWTEEQIPLYSLHMQSGIVALNTQLRRTVGGLRRRVKRVLVNQPSAC